MAVFNGAPYLRAAVDSILDQTFSDFEFVIVDDGSTDETPDILRGFSDPRITLVKSEHVGLTAAVNRGLRLCRGEYVARMDADDICRQDRLEIEVKFMEDNVDIDIVCSDILVIDERGALVGHQSQKNVSNKIIRDALLFKCRSKPIINPTSLIRRNVFNKIGGYRNFIYSEESDLWLRAIDNFNFSRINDSLLYYRIHPRGVTRAKMSLQLASACMAAVAYNIRKHSGCDIFDSAPQLYSDLHEAARLRLEQYVTPNISAFRRIRETVAPGRNLFSYFAVLALVLYRGPYVLPAFSRRRMLQICESLTAGALERLGQADLGR